ncbi:MAG: HAMP domain-containing protein [Rhodobacteraceae bacterium]|nr:HAMP domain-containing protein [Paracoccaceae bacterium]
MIFQWLKRTMPRGIYARAALILLLPVVFVQLVVSVVFTQRHFEDVTRQMTDAVSREIRLVIDIADETPSERSIRDAIWAEVPQLNMDVKRAQTEALTEPDRKSWYDFSGITIRSRLRENIPEIRVVDLSNDRVVRLLADAQNGPMEILFDRRRMSAANPHQLFVNMLFFSIIITIVAFIYMRNQLRPITRLARAAEAFGRGRHVTYSPAGATEVRAAGTAFVDMRARIERMIESRTRMLSGVSHDLRTPLTRMKLELSMMDAEETAGLIRDVDDMQGMIDEFLAFSKGQGEGEMVEVDPIALARDVVEDARRGDLNVTLGAVEGQGTVMLRPSSVRRALNNLISNGVRYGTRAEVSVNLTGRSLRFRVEDDGPGIPADQREEATRVFTRLDAARNQDQGSGVGLGLSIAVDVARAHGGVLRLDESARLGGLCADIVIGR